jgi:hypothetical protein
MNKELINIAKKLRNTLTKEDIDKIYENIAGNESAELF